MDKPGAGKNPKFQLDSNADESQSRVGSGGLHAAFAFLDQDFGSIIKALAALGAFAQGFIDLVRVTAALPRRVAQRRFPYGIADANVHRVAPIDSLALYCEWIAITTTFRKPSFQLRTVRQANPAAERRVQAASAAASLA